MAWDEPPTRSDGDLITSAIWNADFKDNLLALKVEAGKMDDCAQTQSDEVSFQAGAKMQIVTVMAEAVGGHGYIYALCDAETPPTTMVGLVHVSDDVAMVDKMSFSFMVPPGYYYKIEGSGDADVTKVTIWELH